MDEMSIIDVSIMAPYLKYTGTLEDLRARNIMYYAGGPYLKKGVTVKDIWPTAIDDDVSESHTPETSVSTKQVEWYEKNKAMFEQMMLPNEQK